MGVQSSSVSCAALVLASCGARAPAESPAARTSGEDVVYEDSCVGTFVTDGERLYMSGNTSVRADGKGEPRRFTERAGSVLAVDASHVYLAPTSDGRGAEQAIVRARKDGSRTETLATVRGEIGDFELDGETAYFVVSARTADEHHGVYAMPAGGGSPRVLADASRGVVFPVQIAVDADDVYVTDWDTDHPEVVSEGGAVRAVPKTGGQVRTIAHRPRPEALAIDDRFVYFGTDSGSIFRVPKRGGDVEELGSGTGRAKYIVAGRDRLAVLFEGGQPSVVLRFVSKDRRPVEEPALFSNGEATSLAVSNGFAYVGSYAMHPHQGCISGTIVRTRFE